MKFNVSSSELLKGLMDISKAIPAKSALPILENFLFDLKGNILEVTASDSELTLRTEIEVDTTEEEGKIAVPARHIIDLLKELPDQPVAIKTASDSSIECKWASGNSVLPFFPAEDYPEIKGTGDDAEKIDFRLSQAHLLHSQGGEDAGEVLVHPAQEAGRGSEVNPRKG